MKKLSHVLMTIALVACSSLDAQTVYRCGSSYSQTPCPGGNAIDASDPRTPEQRKAREAHVREEKRTGNALEKSRQREEAAAQRAAEQGDRAQREADRAAQKNAPKPAANKERIPAYRAPVAAK
ncbi:MAG: hypothetical protein ACK5RC_12860 [Curvibacter sp.]|jgi:hypothetical protein|nr:hypothetical protein [Curvibacter sp.]